MSAAVKEQLLKDYIPKDATQQSVFLSKYPEYDGRGLKIAILDTGVDLSFEGMQKTTTGLSKVLDCYDFTGAGCVDTSAIKESDNNNNIIGLSSRLLKLPSNWKNPSGQWHLGIKSIYEMCSGPALESIIKKRKESISQQNETLKESIKSKMKKRNKTISKKRKKIISQQNKIFKQNINKKMKKENKANNNDTIEYLKMTEVLSKDSLVADCIVWFDGEKWQACIDTSFIGDLENVKVLTNYNDTPEYDKIWETVSYCIKIHDNGNLLDIITAYDDHGTYVAHVAAACFLEEPERNGLAPDAQIISMTVMDSRKANCLNFHALKKAFKKCVQLKADIINCSFGCPNEFFKKQIKEMTEKHGIIITQAAGNDGPVYSSVCRNSFYLQELFVIGSIEMKTENDEISYKISRYSSRGPNPFGDRGVCFAAPGDVTLEMAEYYPEKISCVKGTSFAAPNAAGSIACLISALKANSIKYSPSVVKFALSKTALLPPKGNVLAYGHGIIQIKTALEFLKSSDFSSKYEICNCKVKLLKKERNGIFLKVHQKDKVANKTYSMEVLSHPKSDKLTLQLTPGAEKFVQCSDLKDDTFTVKVDPAKLKPGTMNYAEIHGINSKNSFYGTIFHLPITVLLSKAVTKEDNYHIRKNVTLKPQIPYRFFILPPK